MQKRTAAWIALGGAAATAAALKLRGGSRDDPAHAPGKQHLGPPPDERAHGEIHAEPRRNQPWVRTSHSDSQQRRFRR